MKFSNTFALLAFACALWVTSSLANAATSDLPTSIVLPAGAHLVQRLNPSARVSFSIALQMRDQAGMDALLKKLYDPGDPLYGHYLTAQQLVDRFSPTQGTYNAAIAAATTHGLSVDHISGTRMVLDVSGTSQQVESLANVRLYQGQMPDGRMFHANDVKPTVPGDLAALGASIIGLNDAPRRKPAIQGWRDSHTGFHIEPQKMPELPFVPHQGDGPGGGYTPENIDDAYNFERMISGTNDYSETGLAADATGHGQVMAVVEYNDYKDSDISTWISTTRGTANHVQVVRRPINGYTPTFDANGSGEVEFDIELMTGIAFGAESLQVYIDANTDQGTEDIFNEVMVDPLNPSVLSNSWGLDENESTNGFTDYSFLDAENSLLQMIAARGISFFSASGDDGAYDDTNTPTVLSVDDPGSQPYATSCGGTTLNYDDLPYATESAWSDRTTTPASGSGGGISRVWSIPSYQKNAPLGSEASTTMRNVPDVCTDADPNSAYAFYFQSTWEESGGTSGAAPIWAGFTACVNENRVNHGLATIGLLNPSIYPILSNSVQYANDFNDVTSGNNLYYNAVAGYDLATGMGSFNGFNLLRDISGGYDPRFFRTTTVPGNTYAAIALGQNGNVYGVSDGSGGTGNGLGTFFRINSDGSVTNNYSFTAGTGYAPYGVLAGGSDGNFYGITKSGGSHGFGGFFKISPSGTYTPISYFTNSIISNDDLATAFVQGSDGNFYLTYYSPFTSDFGGILKITAAGALSTVHSFTDGSDGADPSALVRFGTELVGVTNTSSTAGGGTIFTVSNGAFATAYTFPIDSYPSDITVGADGALWGSNEGGGNFYGAIYRYVPGNAPVTIHTFSPTDGGGDGPDVLVGSSDGSFYGETFEDGGNNGGTLFHLTSSNAYTVLFAHGPNFGYQISQQAPANSLLVPSGSYVVGTGTVSTTPSYTEAFECQETPLHVPCDFNGDQHSDLLWENSSNGEVTRWLMNGTTIKQYGQDFAQVTDTTWHIVCTPDCNGDGHPDIVWWNSKTGAVLRWLMDDTQVITYGGTIGTVSDTTWMPVASMDVTPGGYWSLLWQNTKTGAMLRWRLHDNSVIQYGSIFATVSPTYHVVAAPDMNGDGKSDILFWNSSSGTVLRWLMNDTTILQNGKVFATVSDTNWHLVGGSDLNGSGHPDLLWENYSTGGLVRWTCNDDVVTNEGPVFTTLSNTSWHVVGMK